MKINQEYKQSIRLYLLEKIERKEKSVTKTVSEVYGINQSTVHKYINELLEEGIIKKSQRDTYELADRVFEYHLDRASGELDNDDYVYNRCMREHIETFPDNVKRIWNYAFSEIANNIIDHSMAESADIYIRQNYLKTEAVLCDNGVGIFEKIREFFGLATQEEAISELFKGKITTDSVNHSGEGIFFSSKMMDYFIIMSDGKVFTNNIMDDSQIHNWEKKDKGTTVMMVLSNFSKKNAKEIFDQYADTDGGFFKTSLPIKNIFDTEPVSRSQAKRLCNRLENFREVVLDFEGVSWMGQGFAHQVFVVFAGQHGDIKLIVQNMNKDVSDMYKHVIATAKSNNEA